MSYEKTKLMNLEDGQTLLAAVDGKMSDLKSALSNTQGDVTNIEDNLYSYKTISGNPVIVEDAVADAVKTMRIEIAPVQSGTGDPSPENVRPISGWTGAKLTDAGKNLLNPTNMKNGEIVNSVGAIEGNGDHKACLAFIPVKPSTTYTLSAKNIHSRTGGDSGRSDNSYVNVAEYSSDNVDSFLRRPVNSTSNDASYTFTTGDTAHFVRFSVGYGASDIQFEIGESVTDFEEFNSIDNYIIQFGGTIYGGELTINRDGTGQIVPDMGIIHLKDLTWVKESTVNPNGTSFKADTTVIFVGWTSGGSDDAISDVFKKSETVSFLNSENNTFWWNTNRTGYRVIWGEAENASSLEDFTAFLTQNDPVFCGKLYSPITIPLTAPQVQLLTGYNTVYADTGAILSMLYPVEKYQTVEQADKERIHIVDSTSEPVKTLTDGADDQPMGIQIAVEPVQDKHGYDNPWPAGGYKNMVPGIEQGAINTAGTKTDNTARVRANDYIPVAGGVTYTVNAVASATLQVMVYQYADDQHTERINTDAAWQSIPYTFTTLSTANYVTVVVRKSNNTDLAVSDVSGFQLEAGSSATDYAPYGNVCPISGWTEAELTNTEKNLFDKNGNLSQIYIGGDGSVGTSQYARTTDYIYLPDGKATFSAVTIASTSSNIRLALYDENKIFKQRIVSTALGLNQRASITVDNSEIKYVRATIYVNSEDIDTAQLEYGTVATEYQPFGSTYTIQFGSTVYGGTLTVNKDGTGTLSAEYGYVAINGSEYGITYNEYRLYIPSVDFPNVKGASSSTEKANALTNLFEVVSVTDTYNHTIGFGLGATGNAYMYYPALTSKDAWVSFLNANNLQVVYELATPVTIPLTVPQVKSLLGVNNLYADTGNILSVDYSADTKLYVDKLFASLTNATGVSF